MEAVGKGLRGSKWEIKSMRRAGVEGGRVKG